MDLAITDNGDLQVAEGGDLAVTGSHRYAGLLQEMYARAKTELGDFTPYPWFGTELYKLWGLPNTQTTGLKGTDSLHRALTHDGKLSAAKVNVKATPVSSNTIRFNVDIKFSQHFTHLITLKHKLSEIGGT